MGGNWLLPKGNGRGSHARLSSATSARSNLPTVHVTDINPKLVHVDVQHFRVPEGGGLVRRDSLKFPFDGPGLYVMLLDNIMPYLPPRPLHLDATVVFVTGHMAPGIDALSRDSLCPCDLRHNVAWSATSAASSQAPRMRCTHTSRNVSRSAGAHSRYE